MPYVKLSGIDLYYESHGDGAETLVLAHGRSGGHLVWWQQVPALARRYRVITFDHRGFGRSIDRTGEFRSAFARDLAGLLDRLDVASAYLVGQSMGGWTCLSYAVSHPERVSGLVMADSSGGISDREVIAQYVQKGEPPSDPAVRALGPAFRRRHPAGEFLYRQIGGLNPPAPESLMSLLLSRDGPRSRQLRNLPFRTLFVVGQRDPVVTPKIARACARLMPGSKVTIVPNAGHSVYFEQPRVFNRLIINFIQENGR